MRAGGAVFNGLDHARLLPPEYIFGTT